MKMATGRKSFEANGRFGIHRLRHGERRCRHQQRVTVGRLLEDFGGTDRRAGASLVLDDERLAELDGELLRDDAPDDVRGAARTERHDDANRLVGPVGRGLAGGKRRQSQRGAARECRAGFHQHSAFGRNAHDLPPMIPASGP
jgi:hypothetical protein